MQGPGKNDQDAILINKLLKERKNAKSKNTRNAAEKCEQELEQLRTGDSFDRLVAWYYENVCSGYGYLVRTPGGLRSRGGWITPMTLKSHLGGFEQPKYLAIRPAAWTNWAVFDIDEGSRYHPLSEDGEGIEPVLNALGTIGLNAGLEFQSSTTGGIHVWFPLGCAVHTWALAVAIEGALAKSGLEIRNGVLEIRPNCKSYDSQFQAIRAPLTGEGNGLFVEDFGFSYEISVMKQRWTEAKERNHLAIPEKQMPARECSSNRRGQRAQTGALERAQARVNQGFTGRGQTNELKLACLQIARLVEGLESEEQIRSRVVELLITAPGFEEFCGHKKEIISGKYLSKSEVQRALRLIPGGYINTWKEEANSKRSKDAEKRADEALEGSISEGKKFASMTDAFQHLRNKGAPAKSWWHKKKNERSLELLKTLIA